MDNIEELSRASGCLPQYIRKGIAIATFILGRCYERGCGVKKDPNEAVLMYKKVKFDNFTMVWFDFLFDLVFST